MRARDFVTGNVAYHDELNPDIWQGQIMQPEVQKHLSDIADAFIAYLEIPDFHYSDIILAGSMANYNYTDYSDLDLHVITDYADLGADDLAEAFYRAKKQIWNDGHDITIRGHEVELYVEDLAEPVASGGVYSIQDHQWIRKPVHAPPAIADRAINRKVRSLIKNIEQVISDNMDSTEMHRIINRLSRMRRSGLSKGGEYSVENLSFKILRNQGYIDRLRRAYLERQDQTLSL
jgi:predicted nucleotidyltransferase